VFLKRKNVWIKKLATLQRLKMERDKFLDATTYDFSRTAIIKPPFQEPKNAEVGHSHTRVVIDSRDRDRSLYPTPSQYKIDLESDIQEVTSAELLVKEIPVWANFLINKNNSSLSWSIGLGSEPQQTTILYNGNCATPGDLVALLNESFQGTGFLFNMVSRTNQITILNNLGPFTFYFDDKSDLALILGFPPKTVASDGDQLISTFSLNLLPNKYVILTLDPQFSVNKSKNPVLHNSTALISCNEWKNLTLPPVKKTFNPPINRLTRVDVKMTDYYGNLFDFQNQDHRLEILFESKKHLLKYKSYV